ncbi:MAG: hypothetical protein ACU83P_09980, partial [Gammaproteobacteria bacterium]
STFNTCLLFAKRLWTGTRKGIYCLPACPFGQLLSTPVHLGLSINNRIIDSFRFKISQVHKRI